MPCLHALQLLYAMPDAMPDAMLMQAERQHATAVQTYNITTGAVCTVSA